MSRLPPDDEDLEWLVDGNDFEAFSHAVYDEAGSGAKVEEDGVPVGVAGEGVTSTA